MCLIAENDFGCVDTLCKLIHVIRQNSVYVPNAFTPNNDGFNEFFFPVFTYPDVEKYNFMIFNRWGEQIFQSSDLTQKWDGTYKGEQVQDGIYTWKLRYKFAESLHIHDDFGMVVVIK